MTTCSTKVCGTGGWGGPLPGDPDNSSVLTATSEFGGINLKWTMPASNAHAVAFTKIYRGVSNNVQQVVLIGTQSGSSYFDVEPGSNPTITYYYWIQHVSINGTVLDYVGPASAKAKPEVDKILQLLAGKVETSALAQSLRNRIDIITTLESGITSLNTRLEEENALTTETLNGIKSDISGATSYIQNQMELFADERVAFANAVNTHVSAFSDEVYAAIQEETNTRAEETGALFGEKSVKIDLAGNVSGYGLSAYVDPDGTSMSEFRVAADRFSVSAPAIVQGYAPMSNNYNGKVWVDTSVTPNVTKWYNGTSNSWQTTPVKGSSPFIVKTSPETIDGITIPAGVYINNAVIDRIDANQINTRGLTIRDSAGKVLFGAGTALDTSNITGLGGFAYLDSITSVNISTYIESAAIGTAYIADAAITNAKIASMSADKITAGALSVGESIYSSNYSSGSSGWKINSDGSAEFNGVVISRNNIVASGTSDQGYVYFPDNNVFMVNTGLPITAWSNGQSPFVALCGTSGTWYSNTSNPGSNNRWGVITEVLPWTQWSGQSTLWLRLTIMVNGMSYADPCKLNWVVYKTT